MTVVDSFEEGLGKRVLYWSIGGSTDASSVMGLRGADILMVDEKMCGEVR